MDLYQSNGGATKHGVSLLTHIGTLRSNEGRLFVRLIKEYPFQKSRRNSSFTMKKISNSKRCYDYVMGMVISYHEHRMSRQKLIN